jgi:proteasome alpha subunit
VGESAADDQMYRITFDGSVADEHGFVAMGGQADQLSAVLKERYTDGMPLSGALAAALAALGSNGETPATSQLEVAVLVRGRTHRAFRRLTGPRLAELLAAAGVTRPEPGTPPEKPGEGTEP